MKTLLRKAWTAWADAVWPKNWIVAEDLGDAGFLIVSYHRTSADAVMSTPVEHLAAGVEYRVMHVDEIDWMNAEDSRRLLGDAIGGEH